MSEATPSAAPAQFAALESAHAAGGAGAVFDRLVEALIEREDFHKLFDAALLRKKHELGLPLHRPTSFEDVPAELKEDFEKTYVASAREVGERLLGQGKLGQAWIYFHAIREVAPVTAAIEAFPMPQQTTEASEEIIDLGLFKGLHPTKGLQVMLRTHGTCSTITSLDQQFAQLKAEDRAACAAVLVRRLHEDLLQSVQHEVRQRMPLTPAAKSLRELIEGRDWLFEDNNYHIDVSHLHSTVRFARALALEAPELMLARDLSEYGARLSPQFQYGGDPPFDEFYPAHIQFFRFLSNDDRPSAVAYFRQKLEQQADGTDQALIAYVLVDLLVRIQQFDEAIPLAEKYLVSADDDFASAFAELCQQAQRFDALRRSAAERNDLVTYAAALLQEAPSP